MHFYALSYKDMMALPIRAFWFMNATIDRINAQHDIRAMSVAMCGQSGEMAMSHRDQLILEIGTVVVSKEDPMSAVSSEKDSAGIADLKAMQFM
jgi:hypothetical protein